VGTLVSGAIYQYASESKALAFGYCFVASTAFSAISTLLTLRINDQAAGLACGPCLTCVAPALPAAEVSAAAADAAPPAEQQAMQAPQPAEAPHAAH
jgi:hypothetical protein